MMGDIHLPRDTYKLQERFLNKLKEEIANVDGKIEENIRIRQQMENAEDTERLRAQRQIEKLTARNMVLQDELERVYTKPSPPLSPAPNRVITDVITKRTKEFADLQHEKAMQYKYLLAEKQRLQQAQERLREKRLALHRMPTPEGKMTQRYWGHKYDLYTPLSYNSYFDLYAPVYDDDGYYSYFPYQYVEPDKYPVRYWDEADRYSYRYRDYWDRHPSGYLDLVSPRYRDPYVPRNRDFYVPRYGEEYFPKSLESEVVEGYPVREIWIQRPKQKTPKKKKKAKKKEQPKVWFVPMPLRNSTAW